MQFARVAARDARRISLWRLLWSFCHPCGLSNTLRRARGMRFSHREGWCPFFFSFFSVFSQFRATLFSRHLFFPLFFSFHSLPWFSQSSPRNFILFFLFDGSYFRLLVSRLRSLHPGFCHPFRFPIFQH
ncbi:hypothetical protein CAOG_009926 [Capsaspora owczarzaki ATCC 30864]|uniref:Transmembrane protein n=1 Tax=Capsaspora owczarzaki (strain ATCC 30864) TaxID=595528 RepID=A0A0D2WUA5_CAPO3|nr:hypothetical protein CAOG_009926 [Capsaspora owczarzaki ATCC 30864]